MRFPFPTEESPAAEADSALEPKDEQPVTVAVAEQAMVEQPVELAIVEPPAKISSGEEFHQPEAVAMLSVVPSPTAPASEPEPDEAQVPAIQLPPRPQPRRKIIAFPAPAYAPVEAARRLADPVQPEQLRILDVPEELQAIPATSFLEGLLDAPPAPAPSVRADLVELPSVPVRGARRAGAALVDLAIVLGGVGVCAAVAGRFLTQLPSMKFVVGGAVAVSVMLWASYQYLFLVFGGRTLGMRAARVRLETFKGRPLNFRQRRLRVVGLYLSVLSLGMGVLWHFVDVDSLCWHDRISQTFPVAADKV